MALAFKSSARQIFFDTVRPSHPYVENARRAMCAGKTSLSKKSPVLLQKAFLKDFNLHRLLQPRLMPHAKESALAMRAGVSGIAFHQPLAKRTFRAFFEKPV